MDGNDDQASDQDNGNGHGDTDAGEGFRVGLPLTFDINISTSRGGRKAHLLYHWQIYEVFGTFDHLILIL